MKIETVGQRKKRKTFNLIHGWPRKKENSAENSTKGTYKGAVHRLPKEMYHRIHGYPKGA